MAFSYHCLFCLSAVLKYTILVAAIAVICGFVKWHIII